MKIITFTLANATLICVDGMDSWEWRFGLYTIVIVACVLYAMWQFSKDF
jgi:hypothetical protein